MKSGYLVTEGGYNLNSYTNADYVLPGEPPVPPVDLNANLAYYWTLNEGSGNPRVSSVGTKNATESGGAVASTTGKHGNCASFAGTSLLMLSGAWAPPIGGEMAMSCWVNIDPSHNNPACQFISFGSGPYGEGFLFATGANATTIIGYRDTGGGNLNSSYLLDLAPGWNHLVLNCSADNHTYLWRNGSKTGIVDGYDLGGSPANLENGGFFGFNYKGLLDEVGFWTGKQLSQAEIQALYNGGVGTFYPFV